VAALPFCGTDEHARLRGLAGATTGEDTPRRRLPRACGAWVKTARRSRLRGRPACGCSTWRPWISTSRARAPLQRPGGLGAPLDVRVLARQRRAGGRDDARPATICRELLAALEPRRAGAVRRKRDTTPTRSGSASSDELIIRQVKRITTCTCTGFH